MTERDLIHPELSIIIPVYNGERFLRKCLSSIVNQNLDKSRYEVVVVDDCSSDSTPEILKEYEGENFRVVHKEKNGGLEKARITGFKAAKGKYIGWVDADDFIEPDMYERMLQLANDGDLDIVLCNYAFESDAPVNRNKWFHEWKGKMDWEFIDNNMQHWNKIMRRSLMEERDFVRLEVEVGEDSLSIIMPFTDKIASISDELYHYRITSGSMSANRNNLKHYENDVITTRRKVDIARELGMSEEWVRMFSVAADYREVLAMIIAANSKNKETYKKYRKMVRESHFFSRANKHYIAKKFSRLQAFVIHHLMMLSYPFARFCCKIAF